MLLKGLQKLTLLDYPGKMACTVFTGGCNFKCPFCHNASLVISERVKESSTLPEEEFFAHLAKRRGILEGVCITGGEPTLSQDLVPFLYKIKDMGFLVKLDTNGYRPDTLASVIDSGCADYIAMDIKNSKEKYGITVGIPMLDLKPIEESVHILMSSKVDFEFRTTLTKELHTEDDIIRIGEWLRGDEKYFLQTFKDSGDLISAAFSGYDESETKSLLKVLKTYIPSAEIRG